MKDDKKTKDQLLAELQVLRKCVTDMELSAANRKYTEAAVEAQADTFFVFEPATGKAIRWNKAFRDISGYSDEEIAAMKAPDEWYGKEDLEKAARLIEKMEANERATVQLDFITKSGKTIPTEYVATVVRENNEPKYIISIGRDLSGIRQMEQALRDRIVTLTRPIDDASDIGFNELFSIKDIQKLQDKFAAATGVASIITQIDGTPITEPSNFCRLCNDIIRKTEKGLANCYESDAVLGKPNPKGSTVQQCKSGGLWDAGAAISVGGKHVANWLIGQVRDETQSEEKMRQYAQEIKADEKCVVEAFREVKSMSREQFDNVADALFTLASQLSASAYQNVQQARFITERNKAEEKLRESENNLQTIFQATDTISFITTDLEGEDSKVLSFSPGAEKIFGYTKAEMIGRKVALLHPEEVVKDFSVMQEALRDGSKGFKGETTLIRKSGERFPATFTIHPLLNNSGELMGSLGVSIDIAERKKAEAELNKSEKQYQGFLENLNAGVVAHAPDTSVLFCNKMSLELLGLTMDQMLGKEAANPQWKFLNEDGTDMVLEDYPVNRTLNTQAELKNYVAGICKQDQNNITWVSCNSFMVHGSDEKLEHVLVSFFDITERRRAEKREKELRDQLARSERMEALGVLAGGVAHDLNNTLGPLVTLPELILDNLMENGLQNIEETKEDLNVMRASAKRAARVIKDLVSLGRRGNYSFNVIDINTLSCIDPSCREMEYIKEANPGVSISCKLEEEPLFISADKSHFARIIWNLIQNAVEAIQEKGDVKIKTFRKKLSEPFGGYEVIPKGDYAVVKVSDTGSGIGKKHLGRIFEPFYTQKEQSSKSGSGLGLSVVHGIIKDHHGFINVKSEINKGSTFSLYFPLIDRPQNQNKEVEKTSVFTGAEHVLVVDDEPAQRFIVKRALGGLGYTVEEAKEGYEAVKYFEKAKKDQENSPCDLVILDMIMKEDLDGLDTYKKILKYYPGQKVIIVSGHAEDKRVKDAVRLGAGWLSKPYVAKDLLKLVREKLDS